MTLLTAVGSQSVAADPVAGAEAQAGRPAATTNLALNPGRTGTPNPQESDPGWGGGTDTWDILDGQAGYFNWAEGLAFLPGGHRQLTIDFGRRVTVEEVVIWHHVDCCRIGHNIPAVATVEFFDGTAWHPTTATRAYDLSVSQPTNHGSQPDRYTFAPVKAAKIRWSYDGTANIFGETGGWHGWVYEAEAFGTPTTEYEINLTTFIPGNNVLSPWHFICDNRWTLMYFAGDNRGFAPDADSFRTRQKATVVADGSADADGIKDGTTPHSDVRPTKLYNRDAMPLLDSADDDAVLDDCHLLHAVRTADTAGMTIEVNRTGPESLTVGLRGHTGNPLIPQPFRQMFSIDWNLSLAIDESTSPATWHLTGREDGFPAIELYLNGECIYRRNAPPPHGLDMLKLQDGYGDVLVDTTAPIGCA